MHTHTVHGVLIALPLSSSITHPSLFTIQDPDYKYTALRWATVFGHVEAVKALVAADPDPAHLNMRVSIP